MVKFVASNEKINENSRSPRHLTFNSVTDDIEISLDFTVPFLKIPLKETLNFPQNLHMGLPKINIDPKSLALGGAMVVVTSVLASIFSKGFPVHQDFRHSRNDDSYLEESIIDTVNMLMSRSHSCPSRVACWAGRNYNKHSIARWKQITRNKLLATIFNTTEVEYAFRVGRKGGECESFRPCPLSEEQLTNLYNFSLHNSPSVTNN